MVTYARRLVLSVMALLLSQIVLFSLYSCWHNQQEYGSEAAGAVPPLLSRLVENPILARIAEVVGYAGGYGFYAPRVGSHFITEFRVYTDNGPNHTKLRYPALRTLEGRIRYRAFSDLFSSLIPEGGRSTANDLQARTSRAMARSISERLASRENAITVVCHVGVWYPRRLHLSSGQWSDHYVELHQTVSR